jgi:hypothetical protein
MEYSDELISKLDIYIKQKDEIVVIQRQITNLNESMDKVVDELEKSEIEFIRSSEKISELRKDVEYQTILEYQINDNICEVIVSDIFSNNLGIINLECNGIAEPEKQLTEADWEYNFLLKNENNYLVKSPLKMSNIFTGDNEHVSHSEEGTLIGKSSKETYKINLRVPPISDKSKKIYYRAI